MSAPLMTPGLTDPPAQSARAFRAAMNALAHPGVAQTITGAKAPAPLSGAAATLIVTLCDQETPIYLAPGHDNSVLRDWIMFHTSAPLVGRQQAMFAVGAWRDLLPLSDFAIGTPEYPDRSATLIVEADGSGWTPATLTGPGIRTTAQCHLPEIAAFQANAALFPLGLDFFFSHENSIHALPRTTKVETL